jgi:hypothetical protein
LPFPSARRPTTLTSTRELDTRPNDPNPILPPRRSLPASRLRKRRLGHPTSRSSPSTDPRPRLVQDHRRSGRTDQRMQGPARASCRRDEDFKYVHPRLPLGPSTRVGALMGSARPLAARFLSTIMTQCPLLSNLNLTSCRGVPVTQRRTFFEAWARGDVVVDE